MEKYIIIGEIVNTHGVKGEVKVIPLTDNVNRFKKLKKVYIDVKNQLIEYIIENIKVINSTVIIKFENITDMSQAENLKNCYIKIDR
jgi:16S rRNA processing protein RimM